MKKNGFIATSLIYAFFLMFITLFLGVIADYLQNKVLLEEIEHGIKKEINETIGIKDFEVGDILSGCTTLAPDSNPWIISKIDINEGAIYLYSYNSVGIFTETDDRKILNETLIHEDLQYSGVFNNTYLNKLLYFFNDNDFNLSNKKIDKNTNCYSMNADYSISNTCSATEEQKYRERRRILVGNTRYNMTLSPDGSITVHQ